MASVDGIAIPGIYIDYVVALVRNRRYPFDMSEVGVHEAKTTLSKLLRRVAAGEPIVITRAVVPVANLVPVAPVAQRRLDRDAGAYAVPDDFDEPLPDDVLAALES